MGIKTYRPSRDDRIPDASETLDGKVGQIIKHRLIPQMAVRSRIAVQGQEVKFYLFQKIRAARRCSCMKLESAPSQKCVACFQTALVGGFNKYGTHLSVFDITHPNTRSVNVFPDYKGRAQPPVKYKLIPGSTYGYVETKVWLKQNIGRLDELFYDEERTDAGDIRYLIKAPGDADWVEVSERAVGIRLGNPYLLWRVELRRTSLSGESPQFGLIYLRYQSRRDMAVSCDIPKTKRSRTVEDTGEADEWQRQSFWMTDKVRNVNSGDFLVSLNGADRWKIYETEETSPVEILTSWDLTTRLVQFYEPQAMVPLGNLSTKVTEELNYNDPAKQREQSGVGR